MGTPPPVAVIFDMDGLLLDTERVAMAAFLKAAEHAGIAVPDRLFDSFIGKNWRTTEMLMKNALGPEDSLRMLEAWQRTFEARVNSAGVPKKPGAEELLSMLRGRRMPVGLATSTGSEWAGKKLEAVGLLDYFPVISTGDEVTNGKPAPDIYLLTAERLEVSPERCLVLEDSEPGVEAASAAGMRVVMVPDLQRPSPEITALAERVCESLFEARAFLEDVLTLR